MSTKTLTKPPENTHLICRKVGRRFVFTCPRVAGLHYAVDELKQENFDLVLRAFSAHASAVYNQTLTYKPKTLNNQHLNATSGFMLAVVLEK